MPSLYQKSLSIIKNGQSLSGAYVASPNFSNYQYCWLRDGSFIAYSMDLVGEYSSAEAFFRWVGSTLVRYAFKVDAIAQKIKLGQKIQDNDALFCRFTLDGKEENYESGWGKFQLDGYGTWLWALAEHVRLSGKDDLLKDLNPAIQTIFRFIQLTWKMPTYDCWEEFPEFIHTYTLGCLCGGLKAIQPLIDAGRIPPAEVDTAKLYQEIHDFILESAVRDGKIVKYSKPVGSTGLAEGVAASGVDASLLGLIYPYKVIPYTDVAMKETLAEIESQLLRQEGGVYRYRGDVYYGGGEWILLTAWLGWVYLQIGQRQKAEALLKWIEVQADANLNLPEQVNEHTLFPQHYQPWVKKWGPVANPLLWSHAMYLILFKNLQEK